MGIYAVPDTIFHAGVREMKNIPQPLESSLSGGADRQVCGVSGGILLLPRVRLWESSTSGGEHGPGIGGWWLYVVATNRWSRSHFNSILLTSCH